MTERSTDVTCASNKQQISRKQGTLYVERRSIKYIDDMSSRVSRCVPCCEVYTTK